MVRVHEGELSAEDIAVRAERDRRMPVEEAGGYHVGQHGWIDVLDSAGRRGFPVEGEIVRLVPTSDNTVHALIRTRMGIGVYRVL